MFIYVYVAIDLWIVYFLASWDSPPTLLLLNDRCVVPLSGSCFHCVLYANVHLCIYIYFYAIVYGFWPHGLVHQIVRPFVCPFVGVLFPLRLNANVPLHVYVYIYIFIYDRFSGLMR